MASMIRLSPRRDRPGIASHGVDGGEFVVVRGMGAPSPRRVSRLASSRTIKRACSSKKQAIQSYCKIQYDSIIIDTTWLHVPTVVRRGD